MEKYCASVPSPPSVGQQYQLQATAMLNRLEIYTGEKQYTATPPSLSIGCSTSHVNKFYSQLFGGTHSTQIVNTAGREHSKNEN
jgi:hypothetical protein